ncbi:MAG TPA: RDD family protein [Planctomicrobium sp.]|nr:RDD family protein [Planctomicrobium sp.]
MAAQWYYRQENQTVGPLTTAQLKQAAQQQVIDSNTPIRKGEAGQWGRAAQVKGLFAAATTSTNAIATSSPESFPPVKELVTQNSDDTSDIAFECHHCFHPIRVPSSAAGRKGTCQGCGSALLVPDASEQIIEVEEWDDGHSEEVSEHFEYVTPIRPRPKPAPKPKKKKTRGEPAGFWKRVIASGLDSLVLSLISVPIYFSIAIPASVVAQELGEEALMILAIVINVFYFGCLLFVSWLYHALLECSSWQGTLGKIALGMRVTDLDRDRITFGRATGRYLAKFLSSFLFIGYLMVAFTENKQGLHDLLSGCLVVNRE